MLRILAMTTMLSGVRAKRLAVAAGIMSNEVIIKAPTNFILNAIVNAVRIIRIKRILFTLMPSTCASSGLIVVEMSGFQK